MAARKKAKSLPAFKVGDMLLLGGTRASYPGEWYHGKVLWFNADEVLVQRSNQNGETYTQIHWISEVRASGDYDDLARIQNTARKGVDELRKKVSEAETALGQARDALWAHLETLAIGGLTVPDFDAMAAEEAADRAVRERSDQETYVDVGAAP